MEAILDTAALGGPDLAAAGVADSSHVTDARAGVVELYREYHRSLVRLAALAAPDPAMAEDLVQEAFVRLYGAWDRVADTDRAIGYVRATVVNLARGRARRAAVALRHRPGPPADVASAEDVAMGRERRQAVLNALRRLPARQRECLVLRHYYALTESHIATELGISIGSVRKHTQRGMAAMDRHLEGLR